MADLLLEIKRGDEAARIIENPLFIESVEKVRDGLIESMARSPLGDATTHNRLVIALQLLAQIENSLKDVMQTGKMAKIQVADKGKFNIFG